LPNLHFAWKIGKFEPLGWIPTMTRIYKLSGRFTPIGIVTTLAAGLAAGVPLAFIYAWGIMRIPEEKLSCFATLGYGALIGVAVAFAGRWGRIRNQYLAGFLAVCAAVASYYLSWAFWLQNVFHKFGQHELDAVALMRRPDVLWNLMKAVNEYGTWGTAANKPTTGTELWIIWGFEALGVFSAAAATAVAILRVQPFCEPCQLWCSDTEKIVLSPVADVQQARRSIQLRDFTFLQELGPGNKRNAHLSVELHSCPNCRDLNTLTLKQQQVQPRKFRSPSIKHVTLADKLLVSRQEADAFRMNAHNFKQLSKAARA